MGFDLGGIFSAINETVINPKDIFNAGVGFLGQHLTNSANNKQALRQMRFQKEMSDTAHQREVADLEAAGLNPILSATGGNGASTPAGAMATMEDPISRGLSSALSASQLKLNDLLKKKTEAETNTAKALEDVYKAQAVTENTLRPIKFNQGNADVTRTLFESDYLQNRIIQGEYQNWMTEPMALFFKTHPNVALSGQVGKEVLNSVTGLLGATRGFNSASRAMRYVDSITGEILR